MTPFQTIITKLFGTGDAKAALFGENDLFERYKTVIFGKNKKQRERAIDIDIILSKYQLAILISMEIIHDQEYLDKMLFALSSHHPIITIYQEGPDTYGFVFPMNLSTDVESIIHTFKLVLSHELPPLKKTLFKDFYTKKLC